MQNIIEFAPLPNTQLPWYTRESKFESPLIYEKFEYIEHWVLFVTGYRLFLFDLTAYVTLQGNIETILVIPNMQDAMFVMQHSAKPPPRCSQAYTSDGDEVFEDRFYSNPREPVSRFLRADVADEIKWSIVPSFPYCEI